MMSFISSIRVKPTPSFAAIFAIGNLLLSKQSRRTDTWFISVITILTIFQVDNTKLNVWTTSHTGSRNYCWQCIHALAGTLYPLAFALVLPVIESPGVADTHWVKVFNRTNDDTVVVLITNNFHLKIAFPTTRDSSISSSLVGERSKPRRQISSNSSLLVS